MNEWRRGKRSRRRSGCSSGDGRERERERKMLQERHEDSRDTRCRASHAQSRACLPLINANCHTVCVEGWCDKVDVTSRVWRTWLLVSTDRSSSAGMPAPSVRQQLPASLSLFLPPSSLRFPSRLLVLSSLILLRLVCKSHLTVRPRVPLTRRILVAGSSRVPVCEQEAAADHSLSLKLS